jgi:dihydropteroate synthase
LFVSVKVMQVASVLKLAKARRGIAIMGICNVTPDSFSDGGRAFGKAAAQAHIERLIAEGADIVDIGAESTRPGATPVAPGVQLDRALELVGWASTRTCVSIDTTSAEVAKWCVDAGAHVVNDTSLLADQGMASVCAKAGAALVLSHAVHANEPSPNASRTNSGSRDGDADVVAAVLAEWEKAARKAESFGVSRSALVMDPGLGFSKSQEHSFELLRRTSEVVTALDVPVLIGASRKSLFTLVAPRSRPFDRLGASIAAAIYVARHGASIVRVHDVQATAQAIDVARALRSHA